MPNGGRVNTHMLFGSAAKERVTSGERRTSWVATETVSVEGEEETDAPQLTLWHKLDEPADADDWSDTKWSEWEQVQWQAWEAEEWESWDGKWETEYPEEEEEVN